MKQSYLTKFFAVLAFFGMGVTSISAQDAICSASAVTLGATVSADNTGATPDGAQATCWSDAAVEGDIWFSFIAPATGSVNVTTTAGTNDDSQVAIYSTSNGGCTGTLTEVGCNDDISASNYMSSADGCGLVVGDLYYIQVDGWQGTAGTFDMVVTEIPSCTPITCDASDCEAGSLDNFGAIDLCPDDLGNLTVSGMVIPADAGCDASGAVLFTPDAGATGGLAGGFTLFGVTFPYDFDSDVNGVMSGNGLDPLRGLWHLRPAVYIDFDDTVCDTTFRDLDVTFLNLGEGICDTAVACVAGSVVAGDQTVCPGEAVDFTLSGDHDLPSPGEFNWYFENSTDTADFRFINFGSNPAFYQYVGDLNGLFAANAIDTLTPGDWFFYGLNIDLSDTTACDFTPVYTLTILDGSDPACGGVDCSVFDTAPVDLTKSFDPVGGVADRVQVKWYKASPAVRYTDADAAACDIKFWAKRNLDPVTGNPVGGAISNPDTILITDAKKTNPDSSPKSIFKWPVKFKADGANNNKRVDPNIRYEWQVRCACEHGAGQESPWSDVKIFNTPDFDTITGIYGGVFAPGDLEVRNVVSTVNRINPVTATSRKANIGKIARKKTGSLAPATRSLNASSMGLYPNPTDGVLNITLDTEATSVRVLDLAGRTVMTHSANGSIIRMDVSELNSGMYVIEADANGVITRQSFVVKK